MHDRASHESLLQVLNATTTSQERLVLQPSLFEETRKTLVPATLFNKTRLHLLADGDSAPPIVIDSDRGDYIFKIEADYYFSSNDTAGRIVRISGQ